MSIFGRFNFINGTVYIWLYYFPRVFFLFCSFDECDEIRLCLFYLVNKIGARARHNSNNDNRRVVV